MSGGDERQALSDLIVRAFKRREDKTYGGLLKLYASTFPGDDPYVVAHWRRLVHAYFDSRPAVGGSPALAIERLSEKLTDDARVSKVYRSPSGYLKVQIVKNGQPVTWTWLGHWQLR
jgi:hypothetical protein